MHISYSCALVGFFDFTVTAFTFTFDCCCCCDKPRLIFAALFVFRNGDLSLSIEYKHESHKKTMLSLTNNFADAQSRHKANEIIVYICGISSLYSHSHSMFSTLLLLYSLRV